MQSMLTQMMLAANQAVSAVAAPHNPRILPQEVTVLEALSKAETFIPITVGIGGAAMILFGWKVYKWIVVLNCIALGFWVGNMMGEAAQITMVSAIIGGILLGAISWPMMKYAVALCGASVGFVLGMVVWTYFQPEHVKLAWAGGLVGLVLFGMLSFTLFKTNVILFTCVQGAAMLVLSASAILIKHSQWKTEVHQNLTQKPVLLPLLVIAVSAVGIFLQHRMHGLVGNEGSLNGAGKKPAGGGAK
jgi:hypothetical protein